MTKYCLLLNIRSLTESSQQKNYLLKIYSPSSGKPSQVENIFAHNYQYVYNLWSCKLNQKEIIRIELFQKCFSNLNKQILVRKGESSPEVTYTYDGEKYKFFGSKGQKCVLILHFRVQNVESIQKQLSNQKLKEINQTMENHLQNCKKQLQSYQNFLLYTNNIIKDLKEDKTPTYKHTYQINSQVQYQQIPNNSSQYQISPNHQYDDSFEQNSAIQKQSDQSLSNLTPILEDIKKQESNDGKSKRSSVIQESEQKKSSYSRRTNQLKANQRQSKSPTQRSRIQIQLSPIIDTKQKMNNGTDRNRQYSSRQGHASNKSQKEKSILSKYRYLQSREKTKTKNQESQKNEGQSNISYYQNQQSNKLSPDSKREDKDKKNKNQNLQKNIRGVKLNEGKTDLIPKIQLQNNQINISGQIKKRRQIYLEQSMTNQKQIQQHREDSPINNLKDSLITSEAKQKKQSQINKLKLAKIVQKYEEEKQRKRQINQLYLDDQINSNKKQQPKNKQSKQPYQSYQQIYQNRKEKLHSNRKLVDPSQIIREPLQNNYNNDKPKCQKFSKSTIVRKSDFPSERKLNKQIKENNQKKKQVQQSKQKPSRRKKTFSNRKDDEPDRSTIQKNENMQRKINEYQRQQVVSNFNSSSNDVIIINRIKAVLYTNNRHLPKRCGIQFQNKKFITHIEASNSSIIEWDCQFILEELKPSYFLHCKVLSLQDYKTLQQGETLIKGSDIIAQNCKIIKSYLFIDELAVGFLELQLKRQKNMKNTNRNTISLPQIKQSKISKYESIKQRETNLHSMRAKTQNSDLKVQKKQQNPSIHLKTKLSTISQYGSADSQNQDKQTINQSRSMSKIRERKLKLRAKLK